LVEDSSSLLADEVLNVVDADGVVSPAGVEGHGVLGPGEGSATDFLLAAALLVSLHGGGRDVRDELLLGDIEDADALLGTNDEPVQLLGEEDGVDGRLSIELQEHETLNEIPDHDVAVEGTRGQVVGAVDHIEGGDLTLVAQESVHQGHVLVVPNLDGLVPGSSNADSGLGSVVELDAGNGISVRVLVNGVLALAAGVPDLDLVVKGTGEDLTVISRDGNREDILGVADELGDALALLDVPETDGVIPGGGESEA